ncbi:MAG: hypothetical protein ACRD0G_17945 [Acidimicrobiales bacterium]
MPTIQPTDAEVARADVAAEVCDRLGALTEVMPGVYARIVGRLIARCPEIVAAVLDDIEAEL